MTDTDPPPVPAMDTMHLRVHQYQLRHLCRSAVFSYDMAKLALTRKEHDVFWSSVASFLTATANIAKTCWGAGGRRAAEREPIRASLGIDETNPLSSTALRNHLEHFDERVDRWYASSARHHFVDFVTGPAHQTIVGTPDTDIFRFFDPETEDVVFWGEHYSLSNLADAVKALLPIVEQEASRPPFND